MENSLQSLYKVKSDHFILLSQKVDKKVSIISLLRLIDFLLAVFLIFFFSKADILPGAIGTIVVSVIVFVYLAKYHSKLLALKKMYDAKAKINSNELKALEGDYQHFDRGEDFIDTEHPFSFDLDLFGEGSLFQYINRNATSLGRIKLAQRIKYPYINENDIIQVQMAIKELTDDIDWRQNFQAIGMTYEERKEDPDRILEWVKQPPLFKNTIFSLLIIIIPVLTMLMIMLLSINVINFNVFLLYLTIPWGITGSYASKVTRRHQMVGRTSGMLVKFALLLHEIEGKKFNSQKLVSLQQKIISDPGPAGKNIKKLSAILSALDNRLNFVSWALFNGLLLWDILQMKRLENWQEIHHKKMMNWFDVIAEIDSLNGFSNFHFNNQHTTFPKIHSDDFYLAAKKMGHPLIHNKLRVNNDITIQNVEFLIITGANMAGKSTFLRTIAINLILAMCGAPVCAEEFLFKPIHIFTSIRTNDSLQKNESYFYSELKRLKQIIDELKTGKKLFIVLDEILKGTNSKDKHSGSEALLKQFISLNTTGIVATHDVSLGKLGELFPHNIKNYCFEVDINGSQLAFDYKLRQGISKNMNATILMREMGITV